MVLSRPHDPYSPHLPAPEVQPVPEVPQATYRDLQRPVKRRPQRKRRVIPPKP